MEDLLSIVGDHLNIDHFCAWFYEATDLRTEAGQNDQLGAYIGGGPL